MSYRSCVKDNAYVTIQRWMITRLNLKGNDLRVFAIIHGFSQDGESYFTGSLQYLADWCNCTRQGIQKNLKNLIDKNFIVKLDSYWTDENNQKRCAYKVNIPVIDGYLNEESTEEQTSGCTTQLYTGVQLSLPNNINNTIKNNVNTKVLTGKNQKTEKPTSTKSTLLSKKENTSVQEEPKVENKEKEKPKKKNLYEQCVEEINYFSSDLTTRKVLQEYLSLRLQMKDENGNPIRMYLAQWRALLNKLDTLSDTEKGIQAIVKQSIERAYKSFFPVNDNSYSGKGSWQNDAANKNVKSIQMTEEEKRKFEEDIERRRQNGERVSF